ncbi:MAG: YihY family inner membrane protein [Prevotellaceae bacterium]|jgi:membrane protein|nr:YihY family inner membrane protein [Prevotellaceae bacterium]
MIIRIKNLYKKVFSFITHDVWHVGVDTLSKREAFWVRQLKVFLITLKEFNKGKVNQQASSLTFYLLMSIVPIAAMIFAVSKGFGIDEQIVVWLNETFPNQQEIVDYVLNFAESTIKNARGGWLAGIGLAVLLWSSLNMFVQIEHAFNAIWEANRPRSWSRRFADYLSLMLLSPVLLILSSSVTVTFKYYLAAATESVPFLGTIAPFVYSLIPYILIWILFTLLYMVMPNVKVKFMPALIAGIIAGTAFQAVEQIYISSQVGISKYNAIYGSLAALPLFLLCAKIGWQIVLFGAELSFAYQNIDNYELEMNSEKVSHYNKVLLSMYVMTKIVKNFEEGKPPRNVSSLSEELKLSVRAVNMVIEKLQECGLLIEAGAPGERESAYMPALDIHKITVSMVLDRLETAGEGTIVGSIPPDMKKIADVLAQMSSQFGQSGGTFKVMDF